MNKKWVSDPILLNNGVNHNVYDRLTSLHVKSLFICLCFWFYYFIHICHLQFSFHSLLLNRVSFSPAWSRTGDTRQSAGFQRTSATDTTAAWWAQSGSAHQPLTAGNSRFNCHGNRSLCVCDLHYVHFPSAVKGQMFCVKWDISYNKGQNKHIFEESRST